MGKALSLFEYIHYRVYRFFKEKGDNVPEFKGTMVLSLIQSFTIMDIMVGVKLIHDYPFPSKFWFLPLIIVAGIVNWYLYEREFDAEKIQSRWGNEPSTKRIKNGWLISLYLLVVLLIPPVYGYLHVNAKLI